MKQEKVKLIKGKKMHFIGKYQILKNRDDYYKLFDKYFGMNCMDDRVFISYEIGYKEKNIKCFIGKVLSDQAFEYSDKKFRKLDLDDNGKINSFLYVKTCNVRDGYKEIIEYANKFNIQIRGAFVEVTSAKNKLVEIFVEAYDLNVENKDEIKFRYEKLNNISNRHDKKYIGRWIMQGEIVELIKDFKPRVRHEIPNGAKVILELHEDGSNNYDNITWKENYLIINDDGTIYLDYLNAPKKYLFKTYMTVLINRKESNARPLKCYSKKVK